MTSIKVALELSTEKLKSVSETPRYDSEVLLCEVLNKSRTYLLANSDSVVGDSDKIAFEAIVDKRATGFPVAYILNKKSFWDFELYVDDNVLVPRPDTELLVEQALEFIPREAESFVLELGVGSGAISICLARERPKATIIAVDISLAALQVAKKNADSLGVKNILFCNSSWLSSFDTKFDFIVSNPPYLEDDDYHFNTDSIKFEPRLALAAGKDGLDCYRDIIYQSSKHLKASGVMLLEHGYEQLEELSKLSETGGFEVVRSFKDLSGHDRVIAVRIART